jgi:hypothetical protein
MANLKSFEQFVAEQDRAEEIEKDIVDQGTPEEHDAEEADAVQAQGQETNEATDVTGIQADELKDDSKDVTPPVVDADGKEYVKAEDRAEDDSKELEADLAKTADGEVIAKVVVEGEEAEEVTENLDKASIKRMEGVVSQANLKKMLDGISGVISDLTDDGFEYEEAVDYVAFKIDDKLAGKF